MTSEERRQYTRSAVDWPVDLLTTRGLIEGEVKNISFGGAYIQCEELPREDETFELSTLIFEQDYFPFWVSGEIAWSEIDDSENSLLPHGLGVRFTEVSDDFKLLFEDEERILKDILYTSKKSTGPEEDYYPKNEQSLLEEDKESEAKTDLLHRAKVPIILVGLGLLVLVLLFNIFTSIKRSSQEVNQIESLQAKVKQLELSLLHEIGLIDEKLARLEKQEKQITELSHKLDSFAALMSRNHTETSETATQSRYHQVRPGETLYRISVRYGLSVDELRRLNRLDPKAAIHPGQRLIVSSENN